MAQRTIAHMYDRYEDAKKVVAELEAAGIPHGDISLVANAGTQAEPGTNTTAATTDDIGTPATPATGTGAATGATLGTALGGGLGLLAGIGSLAIPGVGPVVAAGWLVATLTGAGIGAAGGGLVGSLTGAGVSHDEANVYAEGVRHGGALVTARVEETEAQRVEDVMNRGNPVDWQQRRASYGSDWNGFNPEGDSRTRVYPSGRDPAGIASSGPEDTLTPGGRDPTGRS
jgi:hypothetical protein